jgi:hypothetical protein
VPEGRSNYGMQAIDHDTPATNEAPWVMPGQFTLRLRVNGKSYQQPLTVKMDPRVRTPLADLTQQFGLSKQLYDDILTAAKCLDEARSVRKQIEQKKASAGPGATADSLDAFDKKVVAIAGGGGSGRGRFAPAGGPDTIASVQGALSGLLRVVQGADLAPTPQAVAAAADRRKAFAALMEQWRALKQEAAALDIPLKP